MAFTYKNLMYYTPMASSATLASSAATVVYANPSGYSTTIGMIEIHNTNNAVVSLILYYVPASSGTLGTPSISSEFLRLTVNTYDTVWIDPGSPYIMSNTNDAFFAVANSSGVNIQIRGSVNQ